MKLKESGVNFIMDIDYYGIEERKSLLSVMFR